MTLSRCRSLCAVTADDNYAYSRIGGLVGNAKAGLTIEGCYASGSVQGSCFSYGNSYAGGILGCRDGGTVVISNSYWTAENRFNFNADSRTVGRYEENCTIIDTPAILDNFPKNTFNVRTRGNGTGTAAYVNGEFVATPDEGSVFIRWEGLPPKEGDYNETTVWAVFGETVSSYEEFMAMNRAGFYVQTKDIDMSGVENFEGHSNYRHYGYYDGGNHEIRNMSCPNGRGMFSDLVCAEIKNLRIVNPLVGTNCYGHKGVLAQYAESSRISNVHVEGGSVLGRDNNPAGGLAGEGICGIIEDCSSSAAVGSEVTGWGPGTGGLVGKVRNGMTLRRCRAAGDVTGAGYNIGGLVGYADNGVFEECMSSSTVQGPRILGGLIGAGGSATVRRCCATGDVTGGSYVGGFIGNGDVMSFTDCCALGAVTATNSDYYAGGFVAGDGAWNANMAFTNCYSAGAVSGETNSGGFDSASCCTKRSCTGCYWDTEASGKDSTYVTGATGLATAEMQSGVAFDGWDTTVWKFTAGMYPRLRAFIPKYAVTWLDDDGETVLKEEIVDEFDLPACDTPEKAATAKYTYTFAGWTPEVATVTGEATYTATYARTINKYTITWKNDDGTTLDSESVEYDQMPTYGGEEPTKAATPKFTYTFAGWTPEVAAVTGEATYTATYDATINEYTITWQNEDGTVIDSADVAYDETPIHADPTKASTAQYHYEFAGWDPEVASVTGEATYTATFTPVLRSYTITWLNEDGTPFDTSTVEYGATPSHAAPTKASTAQYNYTFAGWGDVVAVTGEATYQATFTPVLRSYTITWLNDDNSLIGTTTVAYGTTPTHAAPTKAETAEYTYTFAGWSPAVVSVTGAATYTATFNSTKRSYTITWKNDDGTTIDTTTVEYGVVPAHADATKAETVEYTYTFAGWDKALVAVTGEATYTATFNSTKRSYTITWKNDDGTAIDTTTVEYGVVPAHADATKAETDEYTYEFAGWSPAVAAVTGNATYTATFNAMPKGEGGTIDISTLAKGDVVQNGSVLTGTAPNLYLKIADGATITLDGASITSSEYYVGAIHCLGDATIILAPGSENTVRGAVANYCTGNAIYVPTNSTLTIRGSGSLYADSSSSEFRSAAIGAFANPYNSDYVFPCGDIVIEGGTIVANGGVGIGASGNGGYCGNITITGDANVTATATVNGSAGIGAAGSNGNCGDITISGIASVTAAGKYNGPGIGAADHSTCGDIVISTTGTVTATGHYYAPGIGACGAYEECKCGNITIADTITEVVAQGQNDALGIYTTSPSVFTYGSHLELVTSDENRCYTLTPLDVPETVTVTWKNEDGTTLETDTVAYGATPTYDGETPTKVADAQYTYEFAGWTPEVAEVTGDVTYTTQFEATRRSYTVAWIVEGATVQSGAVEYGQTPTYNGEPPTKESTAEYEYTFTGWSPEVAAVADDATYTAQFSHTKRSYMVSWVVEGATVQSGAVEYGQTPTYNGETPTKESTAEYEYTFTGWSPTVATVTGAATYTAQFSQTKRSYMVSWVVESVMVASGSVEYGTTPVYNGATPTKPEDENYTYTFNGWTPAVVAVIGNATYTATFTATPKETEDPEEPYEGTETIDGIAWSYTVANGEATITGAQFAEGAIAIPETVHDGVPVMAIEEGVFADNQNITEVTISRYVRRIGADVGVKSADWAQNLEEAGFDGSYPAFGNCESLMDYKVDANNEVFEEIGGALYYRNTPANAKELALYPSGRSTLYFADGLTVTKIGDGACAWCHKFTELTIPASVREIGVRSFDFCREIVTLAIPATVTDIGWGAFLMNIALENADINGTDLAIGDYAFYHSFMADNKGNLVIRGGVKEIGFNAFCNSQHLGAVVIEDGVTNIAMNAFSQCYDLSTVTLPDTLTAIGAGAFCGCCELREIIVPLSVDEIGLSQQDDGSDGGAFAGCSALVRIYLPLSLKPATAEETNAYLANVFNGLGLEDMSAAEIAEILTWYSDTSEIGGGGEPGEPYDGTETIDGIEWSYTVANGEATITGVSALSGDVVIPATVTNGVPVTALKDYIGNLRYDDGITSITLPASVTNIGEGNLQSCTALETITVAGGNATYASDDGILYDVDKTVLLVSPGGKTVVTNMPESVVEIASGAFEGSRVQFCMMAQYATNIAERAFSGCSYLSTATIGKHIRNIGAYAFENCGNIRVVNFASDSECEVIGVGAFSGCEKLQKVTIPDSVIVIRGGAFSGCSELFDVTIGSGVAQIGDATVPHYIDEWGDDATMDFDPAFGNCANLMDFKVSKDNAIYEAIDGCIYYRSTPNTAKTLAVYPSGRGDLHFYGGVTVTAIGEGACSHCNKLKKLTIPQSVKDIGIEAFAHCEGVTNVYIQANSVTNISFGAFAWNMNTMDVEVSGSVKTIGEWAFMHNFGPYNLNDDFTTGQLVLHEGIREIGRGAFERCFRIGEIEIPRSVERMGESAFVDTRLARRIVIGNGLRVIPESAFECSWGSKLSELIIGNNVVGIGAYAFSGCEKLRNLNIPSAVWDIGDNAFSGCTSLCALNLPNNLKSIGAGAFGGSSYGMMMSSARALLGSSAQTFDGCTDLRRVLVPNSVTNIGVGAFGAVTSENLVSIYLPSSLKSADDSDTLAFLADQFPGLNLGIGDVTWYDDESELNYVSVTFDPNNGGETESVQVLDYLDSFPVPVTNGYAFAGWWTTSDDSGEQVTLFHHFDADTTLYAHWIETSVTFGEDAPWTAVYDDYHGEMVLQSGDVAFGHTSSASMTVTGPCIVEFNFMNYMDEWGTSNDLMILVDGEEVDCWGIFDWTERTVEIAEVGEHVVTWSYVNMNGSFKDYARLHNFSATPAVAHTVTFNLDGGTMAEATSRQVLRSLGALPIPVKAGYIFNGWWWTDGDGFAERVSTDFAVEDDVELVARWEKSPFSSVGGDASWFLDENGDYRTEAIGKDATVWAELRFKGPANISFDYKASMSWMSDDHFEFVVDGERALYQGGISSWRSHSEAFSDDAEHVVRWVVRRNDYGEEDYEAENCAWLTRLNLPEAITAAETPPVTVDDAKMEEPVDNGDGTRTIAAKEGETLTQSDVASVTVASPVDPAIDITAAYTKTLVDNTIVLQLAVPALEDVPEVEDDDEDPSGMLDDVDDIDDGKIAAMPEPDVSDPDPEKREEVGALPVKMYPGLYYQASWGDDLNNLTPGAKFRADGVQTHIGVIKQTGSRGFYKISVSER